MERTAILNAGSYLQRFCFKSIWREFEIDKAKVLFTKLLAKRQIWSQVHFLVITPNMKDSF